MNNAPIGVFDSGLGGLTSVKELLAVLPGEDIVYFGDTARMPYGVRARDTIIRFTRQDAAFLLGKGVKFLDIACGTMSSTLPPQIGAMWPVPYVGVIAPTVDAALAATRSGRIGVIATTATVRSGAFERELLARRPDVTVTSNGCPTLVTLVEDGHIAPTDLVTRAVAAEYLRPVLAAGVDTLILGCTHFPIIADIISDICGPGVTLINSGREAALAVKAALTEADALAAPGRKGSARFYVSARPDNFGALARLFLGIEGELPVELVEIEGGREE